MPIAFDRYVSITSGVGAGAAVRRRDLIARFFTTNENVPTQGVLEFTSADQVAEHFGSDTDESRRAAFYFGFVSKNISRPSRISYARWASADTAPQAFGTAPQTLAQLQAITAGALTLNLGGTDLDITGLDFSGDTSLADVASTLQVAIRTGTGDVFTLATVTYNATQKRFELTGGDTGAATITITPAATNDAAGPLGWGSGVLLSNGVAAESLTDTLRLSAEASNNFGSFGFVTTLTLEQITEAATWNSTQNVLFQYHLPVLPTDAASTSAALIGLAGVGMTLNLPTLTTEFPEVLPMAVLAATDYSRRAAVQNYMFQTANLTATVTSNSDADTYDPLRINYYGQTQTAGQLREFYQRGVLGGGATAPVDMNTYANEQWLKDDAGAGIMTLLLSLPRVSANTRGRAQVLSVLNATVELALLNGTISVGRTLSTTQVLFITEQTGDPRAFHQVQTSGYWLDAIIESFQTSDNRTEFRADYTLIYAKDDVIRMVEGTHTLI